MSYVLLSDLHLTRNSLDEYRWKWLEEFTNWLSDFMKEEDECMLIILGDITENKDRHQSSLVNRFIEYLDRWRQLCRIEILTGNHDGIDVAKPYFKFLS